MTVAPNEFAEQIGTVLIETIGVCDGMEQLTARFYEMFEGQYQALQDIAAYKVPAGADFRQAVTDMKALALQGLGKDGLGNVIPIWGTRPKTD